VLAHVFPAADVPVVQLSINALQPLDHHLDPGARLAPLREQGVLILGSGNVVHNLRRIDWSRPEGAYDWNRRFDEAAADLLRARPGDVLQLTEHPDFGLAVPTPDHFIPLVYVAALAAAGGETLEVLIDGPAYGSISMTCYTLGTTRPAAGRSPSATTPGPTGVPPEQTNL